MMPGWGEGTDTRAWECISRLESDYKRGAAPAGRPDDALRRLTLSLLPRQRRGYPLSVLLPEPAPLSLPELHPLEHNLSKQCALSRSRSLYLASCAEQAHYHEGANKCMHLTSSSDDVRESWCEASPGIIAVASLSLRCAFCRGGRCCLQRRPYSTLARSFFIFLSPLLFVYLFFLRAVQRSPENCGDIVCWFDRIYGWLGSLRGCC